MKTWTASSCQLLWINRVDLANLFTLANNFRSVILTKISRVWYRRWERWRIFWHPSHHQFPISTPIEVFRSNVGWANKSYNRVCLPLEGEDLTVEYIWSLNLDVDFPTLQPKVYYRNIQSWYPYLASDRMDHICRGVSWRSPPSASSDMDYMTWLGHVSVRTWGRFEQNTRRRKTTAINLSTVFNQSS